jgi:hypothetical protein
MFVVTRFSGSGHKLPPSRYADAAMFVVTRFSGSGHKLPPSRYADTSTTKF